MRAFLFIHFILVLLVCKGQEDKALKPNPNDLEQAKDTPFLNNQKFILTFKKNRFNCLLSINGDTIIKSEDYYSEAKLLDIDEDGYKDIRVFIFSNTPNQCENYLFDKERNTFKLLENCDLDIHKIKGSKFYYSYNRAGCHDMNWESYLSKIENFKLISLGYIDGQGCDTDIKEYPPEIRIYRISKSDENEKVLVTKLPYTKYIPQFEGKWDFIESYWKKNSHKFER